MFGRRRSFHGRAMGEVRSAQQKCVRRSLFEPLVCLHLEHLLSEPDMSRAAITRLQVIAVEDIGVGSPGLLPALMQLEEGWKKLDRLQRARRLIQGAILATQTRASRFVPCWIPTLTLEVEVPKSVGGWRSLDQLLEQLRRELKSRSLKAAALIMEEIFLRHPIEGEADLPSAIALGRGVMSCVWEQLNAYCTESQRQWLRYFKKRFGPPSRESLEARLFLFFPLIVMMRGIEIPELSIPELGDDEVRRWLKKAENVRYELPDWVFDRHTSKGRRKGRGYKHFFDVASRLKRPSFVLGAHQEAEVFEVARALYLDEERRFGAAGSSFRRRRWRAQASAMVEVKAV